MAHSSRRISSRPNSTSRPKTTRGLMYHDDDGVTFYSRTPSPVAPEDMLTEEMIAEMKECFMLFDTDGDGHITKEELGEAMRKMGVKHSVGEVEKMFEEVDYDRNGTIEFAEMVTFMAIKLDEAMYHDEVPLQAFKLYDKDNKGHITKQDLKRVLAIYGSKLTDKDITKYMEDCDKDEDGKITFQEFVNILVAK